MTPLTKLDAVYLKREDRNPTGSVKDRALIMQIQHLIKAGYDHAVISSTGNAAISAQYFCNQSKITLDIFASPKINPNKKSLLINSRLHISPKPISEAFKFSKLHHCYLLRQSTDPIAQLGYNHIGDELVSQLPNISSVFIPVGSGTTLVGIAQNLPPTTKLFAIQPASHCPIASIFDTDFVHETSTLTDALSVKHLPLKSIVIDAIKQSSGSGIVVSDVETSKCLKLLKSANVDVSAEGGLALAGYYKAVKNFDVGKFPVILLTGTNR